MNNLTKAFVEVEKLKISTLFSTEKKLHELFPKVRELEFEHMDQFSKNANDTSDIFLHYEFLTNHFPYLEHLCMNVEQGFRYKYNKENVATALHLNPQIKTLTGNVWLDVLFDTNNCWDANEHFQNL